MKKCAIIYNPESGKYTGKNNLDNITKELQLNNYVVFMCPTKKEKDAISIVENLNDDIDLVICAGGDGTLNEGINGNLKRKKKLLIAQMPVGTTNDVGNMYGFTKDINENIKLLLNGTIKNVDTCLINECPFVYVACIGSFVDASYNTPRELKKKYGRLGYIFNVIHEFRNEEIKTFNLTFEINGEKKSGNYSFIFITNTTRMGGINNIYNDIKLDDGLFEVALCKANSKKEIIKIGTKLLNTNFNKVKDIEYYKTDNIKITFKDIPPSWIIDGEEYKHNKKTFNFKITKEIKMLLPNKNIESLFINNEE